MKVLIAGDFAPRARLAKQIENKEFGTVFSEALRKIIQSADVSLVNFESPVIEAGSKPIPKCGPNLCCTKEAAEAVVFAGFTGVTLANNHILDYGVEGLNTTVETCNAAGLRTVGVGDNLQDAAQTLYTEYDGRTLAIINCCEHEFSIATEKSAGANPLNPVQQYYAIREARNKADYVLVIVHGGHEHFQLPSPRMKQLYRFFIDAGADAVVNHHQHCYSGYEVYRHKPIFYGLGNFCFDLTNNSVGETWNLGYMVELTFDKQLTFKIHPYRQYGLHPTIELLEVGSLDNQINKLNAVISNSEALRTHVEKYYKRCFNFERSLLEPYSGRVLGKLFSMGLLPKFVKGRKATAILNHVDCESHRDKLLYALNQEK